MEQHKNKKGTNSKQSDNCVDFGKALRSSGILIPESDDEVQALENIYGNHEAELPEKFNSIDFMFSSKHKKDSTIIPLHSIVHSDETQLSYAARDGQETLPMHIMNKMKELKSKNKVKKK